VEDKIAILVDDIADTCGTLAKAASIVKQKGAKEVVAIVTREESSIITVSKSSRPLT